jgi:predicted DNA-binding protein (MmcQ/YjbR family)
MQLDFIRDFCLSLPFVTEDLPFDEVTLVFKVKGKLFLLVDIPTCESINLKCDPEQAIVLREKYDAVQPGYHMNKKHWNTVLLNGSIPFSLLKDWIKESYDLVVKGLPKKDREAVIAALAA